MAKLLGYNSFYSEKKQANYFTMTVSFPITGGVGEDAEKIFIDENVYCQLGPSMIGQEIKCDYEFMGARPKIIGVSALVNTKK